ncbi:hypothetical protein GUITHDRAFT_100535 [Guillardia theta CCMP2712]|uniref:Uncharacterized protein n=1 Tax=Guillardia theta (strain CCMP2712) TaxID=905079 RepID=L1JZK3_GUITC|nr:hypothetical protein GUITHDRAFT_100535 [Guillardia theta CCMP2712]EKX53548.1 hypothetical protein GUITHDRAFT_100535 [Guillardia theta CCMP2712]|eukprot:XP_005840528.1 hypothetical protein GUITHDRAFT_100535 [Guillardia theta CCMP2712]
MRDGFLEAVRSRNAVYQESSSFVTDNQRLIQQVEGLKRQLHKYEHASLSAAPVPALRSGPDELEDCMKLSPLLWPRLAFGMLQKLPQIQDAEFVEAVRAVCAEAQEQWQREAEGGKQHDGDASRSCSPASVGEVMNKFATHMAKCMMLRGDVNLHMLQRGLKRFRQLMLEICWSRASESDQTLEASQMGGRKEVAPNLRVQMSGEYLETHQKVAQLEMTLFSTQSELFSTYQQLAKSGKEIAALRKQLSSLRADMIIMQKQLADEIDLFSQVKEENKVQAEIIKTHTIVAQQQTALKEEIALLSEDLAAANSKSSLHERNHHTVTQCQHEYSLLCDKLMSLSKSSIHELVKCKSCQYDIYNLQAKLQNFIVENLSQDQQQVVEFLKQEVFSLLLRYDKEDAQRDPEDAEVSLDKLWQALEDIELDRNHIDRTLRKNLADAEEESKQMSDRLYTNSSLRKETRSISLPSAPSTGQDGNFYIMGLRNGSPAAVCGQIKVGNELKES